LVWRSASVDHGHVKARRGGSDENFERVSTGVFFSSTKTQNTAFPTEKNSKVLTDRPPAPMYADRPQAQKKKTRTKTYENIPFSLIL